jgi:ubiquinone/menaquinone biosynthesis C-methylase UbiE
VQSLEPRDGTGRVFVPDERVETCDLCGADRFHTVDAVSNVVECKSCGCRFVNPRPSQAQITAAYSDPHFYDEWVEADRGRHRMWRKRLNLIRRAAPGTGLLDVGAGIGTFLALARDEAGWEVTGTEVSRSGIALARQRHGIELVQGQVEDVTLPRSRFDTVTLWHVLEHVPSPSRLLEVCHEMLAPGGLLVVAVPNDSGSRMLLMRAKELVSRRLGRANMHRRRYYPLQPDSEVHLSHYSPNVLARLLQKSGFRVQRITVDDQYPEPSWKTDMLVGAYRLVYRVTGFNLGQAILVLAVRQ